MLSSNYQLGANKSPAKNQCQAANQSAHPHTQDIQEAEEEFNPGHEEDEDSEHPLIPAVDGEKCSAVHYQPKQPKTIPVLNRGGAGYETEADLCIKLNRQLILFQTHRLVTGTQTSEPKTIKPNPDLLEG